MKKPKGLVRTLLICFVCILLSVFYSAQAFGQVIRITINQVLESLDHPQLLLLDVRTSENWQASKIKIKGAVRKNPANFDSWANDLPKNNFLVLY